MSPFLIGSSVPANSSQTVDKIESTAIFNAKRSTLFGRSGRAIYHRFDGILMGIVSITF